MKRDWAVNLNGFTLFRRDRGIKMDAVFLYVKPELNPCSKGITMNGTGDGVESIWVEISTRKKVTKKIMIDVLYATNRGGFKTKLLLLWVT